MNQSIGWQVGLLAWLMPGVPLLAQPLYAHYLGGDSLVAVPPAAVAAYHHYRLRPAADSATH